ncbi:Clp protease N-terminal domain-containing protein [Nocardia sp. NPDC005978]|uniref:Clp protease N-terminal domain-containing protein n=1 Tax=unclassified Nocardia TaxID=2637762 RepID=UPI0033B9AF4C
MFSRFSERARRIVILSQEEAMLLQHDYIGTEHLLLGLLHEGEGRAAHILGLLGVDLKMTRDRVEELRGRGAEQPAGHVPFTARAKRVLELSLIEAKGLGDKEIGSEHLLLGLVGETAGTAARILTALDVDAHTVRVRVRELHGRPLESLESLERETIAAPRPGRRELEQRVLELERRVSELEQLVRPPGPADATG